MAAPLIMSFFLGMAIKESEIVPYQDLVENTLLYTGTLMLGLLLGTLCEASTLLNPKVAPLIVLGVLALAVSGAVGILGGYVVYWFSMLLRMKIRSQLLCLLQWVPISVVLLYPLSLAAYSLQPSVWLNN